MPRPYATPRVRQDLVRRRRLEGLFDARRPLTVVRGPMGMGKTTAVAQWAEHGIPDDVAAVWVTATEATSSASLWWRHVAENLADAGLASPGSLLAGIVDSPRGTAGEVLSERRMVRGLAQIDRPVVIIADDLHLVPGFGVADVLRVVEACADVNVVVITCDALPLEGVEHWGDDVREVAPPQLRLTADEAAQMVASAGFTDPSGRGAAALLEFGLGVPGVCKAMVTSAVRHDGDAPGRDLHQVLTDIGEAGPPLWWRGVLKADASTMLALAVPEAVSVDLACALTGRRDAGVILDEFVAFGAGAWVDHRIGRAVVIPEPIRAALGARIGRRDADGTQVRAVHAAYAGWCLAHGYGDLAVAAALRSRDLEMVDRALVAHWPGAMADADELFLAMRASLSRTAAFDHPLLTFAVAMAMHRHPALAANARTYFEWALVGARRSRERAEAPMRALTWAAESLALRVMGNFDDAARAADRALSLLPEMSVEDAGSIAGSLGSIRLQCGKSLLFASRWLDAEQCFEAALADRSATRSVWWHAQAFLAGTLAVRGEVLSAQVVALAVEADPGVDGWPLDTASAFYRVARAAAALEDADADAALEHLAAVQPLFASTEVWALLAAMEGTARLMAGQSLDGAARIASLLDVPRPAPVAHLALLDSVRSLQLLVAGHVRAAEEAATRTTADHPIAVIARARVLLAQGRADAALSLVMTLGATPLGPRAGAEWALLMAAGLAAAGRGPEAAAHAVAASVRMRDRGLRMPFLALSPADRTRIAELVQQHAGDPDLVAWVTALGSMPAFVPDRGQSVVLSPREQDVLDALAAEASATQIAADLFVSANTVKTQLRSIYRKLGASTRAEALVRAGELGLITVASLTPGSQGAPHAENGDF
ncbi:MAG: LuxR C-terminal-related transcriptional regulator [Demequina sp.]|uniref:helix-turn-helix transcriptional regulator n=1 Tax=Demequina sp. TaxID=2050685 RepID=UPI003A8A3ADA